MKSVLLLCTALIAVSSIAPTAFAQTDESNERIETVIVTGEHPKEEKIPFKATFSESTISREAILNITPSPASTVQTLLNTEPSIYATTGGTNGMETDIKFRSFADGEFGETIAGVPLNDIFNSGVTYQADNRNNVLLITRDLESVQLYRGVNNPSVNTYNSLGGTINYVPRQPTDDMGGDVGVDGGSFNTLNYHATFNTGDWNGIKQILSFERDTSAGWLQNTPDQNDNVYYAGNADVASNTELYSYFVFNKNKGDAPQYIPLDVMNTSGFEFQWPQNTYYANNSDTNFLGILGGKSEITNFITVEDEGYVGDNNYRRTSFSNPAYPGPYFIDDQGAGYPFWSYMGYAPGDPGFDQFPYTSGQAYGSGTASCQPTCAYAATDYHFYGYNGLLAGNRAQATLNLPFNKITAGGDFNVGELHSREYWYGAYSMPKTVGYNDAWDEHDTRQMWSIYAQDDFHFWDDRIHITPGLKYIGSAIKDNDALGIYYAPPGSLHTDEHFLSPTIGASLEVIPDFTVYGSYGRNVKFPDITSLYSELGYGGPVPSVTVRPEYAQDYELGARYKWDAVEAEMNVYDENFTDIIYSITPPFLQGASEQVNGGGERFRGVELQLTDDFGEFYAGNWKGYLNASYNEAVCTMTFSPPYSSSTADVGGKCTQGQTLANIPNYLLNAGLTWDYDGWHVDLEGHYVGQQHLQDYFSGLPVDLKNPDYFLVNVGIIKVVPIEWGPANALRFALHVDNLFDKKYYSDAEQNTVGASGEEFYGLAGEGRAVFGSVSIYF